MARTIPSVSSQKAGNLITAEIWNKGPKLLNDWLANRPMFRGLCTTIQTIASSTSWTPIQYALNLLDTDGGHNTSVNNSRYTCQVAGWYWVKGCSAWNDGSGTFAASRVDTLVAKNGAIILGSPTMLTKGATGTGNVAYTASALVQLAVGDYVEIWTRQVSGANQTLDNNSTGTQSDFNVLWVSS